VTRGLVVMATLARREVVRLFRQPARLAGALGTPALLWVFLAGGFAESLRAPGSPASSFATFLLPGMMTLVAVFGATFASLSLIEDRNEGWMFAAIVSPAPRWAIGAGRLLGGAAVTWGQAALLLVTAPLLGLELTWGGAGLALAGLALTSLATTGLGLSLAWRTETAGGFHAVMNLVLMPMWLLSGSIYPVGGASRWMSLVTSINPLTWCTESVRQPIAGGTVSAGAIAGAAAFAVLAAAAAVVSISRPPVRS